jgi:hypothetical protein
MWRISCCFKSFLDTDVMAKITLVISRFFGDSFFQKSNCILMKYGTRNYTVTEEQRSRIQPRIYIKTTWLDIFNVYVYNSALCGCAVFFSVGFDVHTRSIVRVYSLLI